MQIRNNRDRFGVVAQLLHWGMFVLFITLYISAEIMQELPRGEEKWALYDLHKSLGVTALFLVFFRLSWRGLNPRPTQVKSHSVWQQRLASQVHILLYIVMLIMPLSGYVMSVTHGHAVEWFGLWELPTLMAENKTLAEQAKNLHIYSSYTLYALIGTHLLAALWHQFVIRDGIMKRMLPVRDTTAD